MVIFYHQWKWLTKQRPLVTRVSMTWPLLNIPDTFWCGCSAVGLVTSTALTVNIVSKSLVNHWWCVINNDMCFLHQDFEKPSPPQKPLPADPLGRSSRLGRGTTAGTHIPGNGPLPIPIPTVPRPAPTLPLPSRWVVVNLLLNFYFLFCGKPTVIDCIAFK